MEISPTRADQQCRWLEDMVEEVAARRTEAAAEGDGDLGQAAAPAW